ncbi:MAG: phosphoribosylformylglycinamidine cyclo-ligase, partial [Proteobacteria bacterium]|nr:phosphoribosylformylglycinamidine cyclo-ligase [Pseudomonadota bacterium]
DGVGTKLKVAFSTKKHDTIGIDLVAMCVNDIVVSGAEPLFFLDYLSTGNLKAEKGRDIVKGIAKGCRDAGCALIGGETAEMPGMYAKGEYDLAGFAVGVVDKKKIIDGTKIRSGNVIIGLASSGLHSNGFSLARKVLFERMKLKPTHKPKGLRRDIGTELLTPTRIYVKPILKLIKKFDVRGIAHITGGGLTENIPRVLPKGTKAIINKGSWPVPPIFNLIKEGGNIAPAEMMRTFNAGIGMAIIVKKKDAAKVISELKKEKVKSFEIGTVTKGKSKTSSPKVEFIQAEAK